MYVHVRRPVWNLTKLLWFQEDDSGSDGEYIEPEEDGKFCCLVKFNLTLHGRLLYRASSNIYSFGAITSPCLH